MLNQIPIEWIIGIIGVIAAAIGFKLKLNHAKKEGQNEVIQKQKTLEFDKLLESTKKVNEIRSQNTTLKSVIPNDWDAVELLKKGKSSLSAIADAAVRARGRKVKK